MKLNLISLACSVVLASFASANAAYGESVQIELDVYSGRDNPRIVIDTANSGVLEQQVSALLLERDVRKEAVLAADDQSYPLGLGYRGVIFRSSRSGAELFRVANGQFMEGGVGDRVVYVLGSSSLEDNVAARMNDFGAIDAVTYSRVRNSNIRSAYLAPSVELSEYDSASLEFTGRLVIDDGRALDTSVFYGGGRLFAAKTMDDARDVAEELSVFVKGGSPMHYPAEFNALLERIYETERGLRSSREVRVFRKLVADAMLQAN